MTLPKGWTKAMLGEFTLERVEQGEPGQSAVSYIDIGSIDRDLKRVGPTEKVTGVNAPTRARQWVKPGDVLVSLTRPNLNAVALVTPDLDGAVASTGFDVLRPQGILPEWVFNRVRSQAFVSDVCEGVQGVVYPAIRPAAVRRHDLPIPPIQEQRRIVDAIDSYLTRLDDALASLERAQTKLKAYRASVLKAAVEGRLVPTEASVARAEKRVYERAEVLLARILKERRRRWEEAELSNVKVAGRAPKVDAWKAKYEEPVAPDTSALPELPEGWCWASLELMKEFSLYGPRFSSDDYSEEGVLVLRTSDISEAGRVDLATPPRLKLAHEEFERYQAKRGDLLITRTGSLGTLAVLDDEVRAIAGAYLIQYRLAAPTETTWYCFYFLKSPRAQMQLVQRGQGVGRPNLNVPTIDSILIPLPPLAEQARIIDEIQRLTSVSDELAVQMRADLQRGARLRQAVLKWAFEGKLVDQDPSDEPAEKLLARIQAERADDSLSKKSLARKTRGAA